MCLLVVHTEAGGSSSRAGRAHYEIREQADHDHLERGEEDQQRCRGDVVVETHEVADHLSDAYEQEKEAKGHEDPQRIVREHHAHDLRRIVASVHQ